MGDYERTAALEWDLIAQHHAATKLNKEPSQDGAILMQDSLVDSLPRRTGPLSNASAALHADDRQFHTQQHGNGPPLPLPIEQQQLISQGQKPRRPAPKLIDHPVTEGEAAWRGDEEPVKIIRIPDELALQHRSDLQNICDGTGAFIFAKNWQAVNGKIPFEIWGSEVAVSATEDAIAKWIEGLLPVTSNQSLGRKTTRSTKWAKEYSLTPELRRRAENAWDRALKRQLLRQQPDHRMTFKAIGSFLWPVIEYRPDEILGAAYEALDPIRMDTNCHIVFKKEKACFEVMGGAENVRQALMRLRKTCFQVTARQVVPVRTYLLEWKKTADIPTHVKLQQYHQPKPTTAETHATIATSVRGQGSTIDSTKLELAPRLRAINTKKIRDLIMSVLRKLRYYRGSIQMRVRLGVFIAEKPKKPLLGDGLCTLSEYESMITESQFRGFVTKELGDVSIEHQALTILQQAEDLLSPQDPLTETLDRIKPILTASFIIGDDAGDLRLVMSFQETDCDNDKLVCNAICRKWTRLDRDSHAPDALLDVSVTDLTDGSAWQFDISATQAVEESRLPSQLIAFADSIRIDPVIARKQSTTESFIRMSPNYALKSVHHRISYLYCIGRSSYTLELTRFQDKMHPDRMSSVGARSGPVLYEPRWSVTIYSTGWDTELGAHESLAVGAAADWKADFETWFPDDLLPSSKASTDELPSGSGFEGLMEKLKFVEDMLKKPEEDLVGGRIG